MAWFVVIIGINTTSDISQLLYVRNCVTKESFNLPIISSKKKKKKKERKKEQPLDFCACFHFRTAKIQLERFRRFTFTQTANLRFKLRISQNRKQADKNCPEQFLYIKLEWNYLFLSRSNKQLTTIKGKTLSCGTNSRLPFGVNVNLNLSIVSHLTSAEKRDKYSFT